MLPIIYYQRYQKFLELLEQLQPASAATQVDTQKLRQSFLAAQQFFQQQMVIDTSTLDSSDASRVLSYQTEIDKQLNLLGVDVIFLQAARQPQTAQSRQMQISQRLQTLVSYCNALMEGQEEAEGQRGPVAEGQAFRKSSCP